jgi:hypothetical protein
MQSDSVVSVDGMTKPSVDEIERLAHYFNTGDTRIYKTMDDAMAHAIAMLRSLSVRLQAYAIRPPGKSWAMAAMAEAQRAQPQVEPLPARELSRDEQSVMDAALRRSAKVVARGVAHGQAAQPLPADLAAAHYEIQHLRSLLTMKRVPHDQLPSQRAQPLPADVLELLEIIRTARAYIGIAAREQPDGVAKEFLGSLYDKMTEAIRPILPTEYKQL